MPANHAPTPTRVGPYLLGSEIGRGPLGVVYRGHEESSGIPVAVKVMLPELVRSEAFRHRFLRDAELGPRLVHPHVVSVLGCGSQEDILFCGSRLVEGEDLRCLLDREGRLEPIRVLRILRQASSALDAGHEVGVVHQNLKPQNLLMLDVPDGAPDVIYVSDFGMVRPAASDSTVFRPSGASSLRYLSPEQIEGGAVDGRADVYSLACVAFEMLTGCLPFPHAKPTDLMWAHVHGEPTPLGELDQDLSYLEAVFRCALSKHPDDRHLTCGELVDALDQAMADRTRRIGGLRLAGRQLLGWLR